MTPADADERLDEFLDRYDPAIAALGRHALGWMQVRLPGAVRLVYDNYNALVIGFGPTERASEACFSIALYPRWVNLFFLKGVALEDPHRLLKGEGSLVRSIRLTTPADLDDPRILDLVDRAAIRSQPPYSTSGPSPLIIRAVSPRRRPRQRENSHVNAGIPPSASQPTAG